MMLLAVLSLALLQPEEPAADAAEPAYGSAEHVTGFLTGRFSNQRQWDNAAPERESEVGADGLDLQFVTHAQVNAPELGEHVIYVEWRADAADGAISRQRIWVLREDEGGQIAGFDVFTLVDPDASAGQAGEPGAFAGLTPDDVSGYPDGCLAQAHTPAHAGYYFAIDPQTCQVTEQSGAEMRIHASIRALGNSLTWREQGTAPDGSIVYRAPDMAAAYSFVRLRDDD